jgi:glucose-1-phosphate cytidylyltransferase
MTYGDGLGSVDIAAAITFHRQHGKLATMTAVQPPGRFGALELNGTSVKSFVEKPQGDGGWINGGFFVLNPKVLDLIDSDDVVWEKEPLESLAKQGQLESFFHSGFWRPMDTMRDKTALEELWAKGKAPWMNW